MSLKQSYAPTTSEARTAGRVANRLHRDFDRHDFRSLYDAWYADVARWIRALGGPPADRDDLLQEVFVVVHRRLPEFDGRNVAGWLFRITAHRVRDFRRQRWIKNIFGRSTPPDERLAAPGPTPVLTLETREKQQHLERLLATLGSSLRETFVLFEIDGYTGEEIAELQGVPLNTVRARIHRARKKLTGLLAAEKEVP